jgi:hypothetical protein
MLSVVMYEKTAVVQILSGPSFEEDLRQLKTIQREDREFRDSKWFVKNPEKYTHIPAVATALKDRNDQMTFEF